MPLPRESLPETPPCASFVSLMFTSIHSPLEHVAPGEDYIPQSFWWLGVVL